MPASYCYDYPRPSVTVDLAVFCRTGEELRVLLIRRKHDPFAGRWALPGGFLEMEETIDAGARRELKEETGLEIAGPIEFLGVYGEPGRDPRGRTISMAYCATILGPLGEISGQDDAEKAAWVNPFTGISLAFDHEEILRSALGRVREGIFEGRAMGVALLPEEFSAAEVGRILGPFAVKRDEVKGMIETWVGMGSVEVMGGARKRYRRLA